MCRLMQDVSNNIYFIWVLSENFHECFLLSAEAVAWSYNNLKSGTIGSQVQGVNCWTMLAAPRYKEKRKMRENGKKSVKMRQCHTHK